MEENFINWLNDELNQRGWSQRELGRRANLSSTTISDIASGKRPITFDFCNAIAVPLGKQPEEVFRLAGLLPSQPESGEPNTDQMIEEIYRVVKRGELRLVDPDVVLQLEDASLKQLYNLGERLTPEERSQVIKYISFLIQTRGDSDEEETAAAAAT